MSLLNFEPRRPSRASRATSRKPIFRILLAGAVIAATIGFGSTLAANINISSGPIEFGQGVAQTVTCGGADVNITITPRSTFLNESGAGRYAFSSFEVSDIPIACNGVDFTFSFYGDGPNRLQPNQYSGDWCVFMDPCSNGVPEENISDITVHFAALDPTHETVGSGYLWTDTWFGFPKDVNGNQVPGATHSESRTESSFEIFFYLVGADGDYPSPGIDASELSHITVQTSGTAVPVYDVGDAGPGGGKIFYIDTNDDFDWNFLEVAPTDFDGNGINFCTYNPGYPVIDSAPEIDNSASNPFETAIGTGQRNTNKLINNCSDGAGVQASAYEGPNALHDWFLPSKDELALMLPLKVSLGLTASNYWSSSELSKLVAPGQAAHTYSLQCWFGDNQSCDFGSMLSGFKVRAIRSF